MDNKRKRLLSGLMLSLVLTLLVTGCGKKIVASAEMSNTQTQETPKTPEKLKPINLGEASQFAILAYASITSNPSSSINGKVGLMPGTHEMITLDPTEVSGGAGEIIASDDETTPMNLLSNAKVDMVTAYSKAVALVPDNDKIGMLGDMTNGKILKPGVYESNSGLNITSDFTLDGKENDVWIFKVAGHMKVASGVRMILNGGAKPKNVFWQVAGNAVLESNTDFSGTIIAQQFIELKNHSVLTGRAFAKNGYIILNQSTINKP